MTFSIGQKVVCIADSHQADDGEKFVHQGQIYVVRGFGLYVWTHPWIGEKPCVWLEGIKRDAGPEWPGYDDVPFGTWRFRPIVERQTSISIFKKMLTPARHKESV